MTLRSTVSALFMASALLLAVGCQSSGGGPSASAPPHSAVVTTGNGVTTIYLPTSDGGVERLASAESPHCAQCDADIAAYFKGAALAPKCSSCGAIRTPVTVASGSGHN